jgi:hypothetical protein
MNEARERELPRQRERGLVGQNHWMERGERESDQQIERGQGGGLKLGINQWSGGSVKRGKQGIYNAGRRESRS